MREAFLRREASKETYMWCARVCIVFLFFSFRFSRYIISKNYTNVTIVNSGYLKCVFVMAYLSGKISLVPFFFFL